MAWAARCSPWLCPTLLPALFLFFKLMLLWVLSCLYENKNNPKASAGAQPLPEALTAAGDPSPAPPPTGSACATTCRQEPLELLPVPRGAAGIPVLQLSWRGICACGREPWGCSGLLPPP